MRKEDCVFCQIVAKEIPAKVIFENELVLAFLDIDPVAEGHTLIIPKDHYNDIFDIDENLLKEISSASKLISQKLFDVLKLDGINILQNNKEAASQIVSHYHMHIIPRRKDDGFKVLNIQANPSVDLFSKLDETLEKIKIIK